MRMQDQLNRVSFKSTSVKSIKNGKNSMNFLNKRNTLQKIKEICGKITMT